MRQIRLCTAIAKIYFLHPRPVTLVYISVYDRRPTILASSDSLIFLRARQHTRQTGADLI